jgi:hypothetical protein
MKIVVVVVVCSPPLQCLLYKGCCWALLYYRCSSLVKWGAFTFYNEDQPFPIMISVWWVSTFEHTRLVLICMGFQWDEEWSHSTMRISRFPSQPAFEGYQLLKHTQLVLIWVFGKMRSVPFLQWDSDIFSHNQCSTGIDFWTYPTGANMGFWWDEECSLCTMRIRQFPSQPVFDGYQLLNIPNWC